MYLKYLYDCHVLHVQTCMHLHTCIILHYTCIVYSKPWRRLPFAKMCWLKYRTILLHVFTYSHGGVHTVYMNMGVMAFINDSAPDREFSVWYPPKQYGICRQTKQPRRWTNLPNLKTPSYDRTTTKNGGLGDRSAEASSVFSIARQSNPPIKFTQWLNDGYKLREWNM